MTDEPDYGLYDSPSGCEGLRGLAGERDDDQATEVSSCDPERDEFTRNTKLLVKHSGREMASHQRHQQQV